MLEMFPKFVFPLSLCLVELCVAARVRTALNVEQVPQAAAAFLTSGFPDPNLSSFILLLWGFLNLRSDINHQQPSASSVNTPISASRTLTKRQIGLDSQVGTVYTSIPSNLMPRTQFTPALCLSEQNSCFLAGYLLPSSHVAGHHLTQ